MITVKKQDVGNWLLVEYMSALHNVREKLHFFEHKYNQSWEEFDINNATSEHEDFDKWDDYIEWKSYIKMSEELTNKIGEVKHGNFEIA